MDGWRNLNRGGGRVIGEGNRSGQIEKGMRIRTWTCLVVLGCPCVVHHTTAVVHRRRLRLLIRVYMPNGELSGEIIIRP